MMNVKIYNCKKEVMWTFRNLEFLKSMNITPAMSDYDEVYEIKDFKSQFDEGTDMVLEDLFRIFNIERPDDFRGHSMSVSDVVQINNDFYFVDSFGFEKLESFE